MKEENSPLSSAVLLAELSEKLDRVASTSAQASLHTARAVRILDANHTLSARDRMALVDVISKQERLTARLERAVDNLSPRPASLTVVADGPSRRDDEITTTFMIGQPWVGVNVLGKRIPSKWVARIFFIGFVVFGFLMLLMGMGLAKQGVKPIDVVKTAAHYVTP